MYIWVRDILNKSFYIYTNIWFILNRYAYIYIYIQLYHVFYTTMFDWNCDSFAITWTRDSDFASLKQEEGMDIFFIHPFTVKPLPDDISSKKHQVFCAIRANGPLADRIWEGFQLNQPTNQPHLGTTSHPVGWFNSSTWVSSLAWEFRGPRRCHRLGRCSRHTTSAWPMRSPWSQSCLGGEDFPA